MTLLVSLSLLNNFAFSLCLSKISCCKLCQVLMICDSEDLDCHSLILHWGAIEV